MNDKPKVLIIFYTRHGNTASMAEAEAAGAREAGAEVTIKRLADDVPQKVLEENPEWKEKSEELEKKFPASSVGEVVDSLPKYDAIIFGSPTRFGNMASQLKEIWDRTSDHWLNGRLIGKVGGVFTGAASVHGGQETTAVSMMFPMLHHGMIIVGVPYSVKELFKSGSPYGPSGIVGPNADQLEERDLKVARAHGKRIGETASKLVSRGQLLEAQ